MTRAANQETGTIVCRQTLSGLRRFAAVAMTAVAAMAVAGCETAGFFGEGPGLAATATNAPAAQAPARKTVAFAPVIGAPTQVAKAFDAQLVAATEARQVPVIKTPGTKPDYMVRGYVVAAPVSTGTELSYIWDVLDPGDKRVHRISGKEILTGPRQSDPWKNVTPAALQTVASKAADGLNAFIPAAAAPVAQTPSGGTPVAQAPTTSGAPTALTPRPASGTTTPAARPAIASGSETVTQRQAGVVTAVSALVPPVAGAPGDGSTALAAALQRQLAQQGVSVAAQPGVNSYTVKGAVTMGPPTAGKQSIRIQWQVVDPTGKAVGTVSQRNSVRQGSLDGSWGGTADAAAKAAVKGVIELLPKSAQTQRS